MTLSMRKAKLESIYSKYDQVVIRIQFSDKLILQGFFRPRETGMYLTLSHIQTISDASAADNF